MTTLAIAYSFTPKNYFRPPHLIAGLAVLKVLEPDKYLQAKRGTLTWLDAKKHLDLRNYDGVDQYSAEWFEIWWRFGLDGTVDEKFKDTLNSLSFKYNIGDGKGLVADIANQLIDRFVPR